MNIIYNVPPKQPKNTWVAFDTEIFQLNSKQMHRPTSGKFGCLTVAIGNNVYYIDTIDDRLHHTFDAIEDCVWVAQKSDFDITHLRRWTNIPPRKKMWDTMYVERIMWNGYYDGFGLDDLTRRYLDVILDKSLQKSFETATSMSPEQIEYACRDSWYTLQVAKEQKKIIDDKSFDVWKHIDLPALWAVLDFRGFAIDVDKWVALAESNKRKQEELDAQLPFNPRSHVQVKNWFATHGIKLESSDEEHLSDVIRKNKNTATTAVAQMILDSRMYGKRASTYGKDWVDDYIEYEDGIPVVYSEFDINMAETGRMASRSPNLQNIPVRETPEFRDCFIARPGNSLVIADYSAQEPRITAFLSQDKKFMEVFNRGEDIYIYMAREIFHEDIKKGDPRRAQMKSLILGMTYGLSKYGLSKRENIDVDTAEKLLNESFKLFPGVAHWMDKQQKNKKFVTTVPGRKCWINSYSEQSKRNVLNSPIQGCLTGDTLVVTKEFGWVELEKLYKLSGGGTKLITIWDGREFVSAQIAYSGYKMAHRIDLWGNSLIWCSDEHKFMTINSAGNKKWRNINEFAKQIFIEVTEEVDDWDYKYALPKPKPSTANNANHYSLNYLWENNKFNFGLLLGRLSTDGGVYRDRTITLFIADHEKSILPIFQNIISSIGIWSIDNQAKYKNSRLGYDKYAPMYRLLIESCELASQIEQLDYKERIPEVIRSNKQALKGYLRSIFDADGTVNKDNVILIMGKGLSKQRWAREIQQALFLFGITSRIVYMKERTHVLIKKDHCKRFAEKIGFINPIKQEKAEAIHSSFGSKIYGRAIKVKNTHHPEAVVQMYDIVNSETHQFCANGLITHNSAAEMMKKAMGILHDNWYTHSWGYDIPFGVCAPIHDEMVLDVPKEIAQEVSEMLRKTMVDVAQEMCPGVPFKADVAIGQKWSDKK